MIQRLHRLKSKRGYTVMEMVIVIAIIAIMAGTITANTSSRYNRIREANSTAKDFYTTIQTEFTRFQMFDGPLTMSLSKQYNTMPNKAVTDRKYGGIMWYPRAGGNYPVLHDATKMAHAGVYDDNIRWRKEALPIPAGITIEAHVVNNKILSVDWAYTTAELFGKQPDEAGLTDAAEINAARSELSAVLQLELDRKMDYKDGYYYARVVYTNDEVTNPYKANYVLDNASSASIRASAVTVAWAAYCRRQFNSADANTYTFRKAYTSNAGEIVGVVGGTAATGSYLGDTGSSFLAVSSDTTEPNA